jgi:flagellum-specific peptidoglycan hydrolase FlgJ
MASPEQLEILHSVAPAAQAAQRKWGVPASVTLAQWIFESTWGTSKLATTANNYFGIKFHQSAVPATYCEMRTTEFADGKPVIEDALFKKYPDEAASFDDHARLLSTSGRYRFAMQHVASPDDFACSLQTAGYSTSPHYASKLIEAIHDYNLTQFDTPPDGGAKVQERAA